MFGSGVSKVFNVFADFCNRESFILIMAGHNETIIVLGGGDDELCIPISRWLCK